jgi:hypothetical protein
MRKDTHSHTTAPKYAHQSLIHQNIYPPVQLLTQWMSQPFPWKQLRQSTMNTFVQEVTNTLLDCSFLPAKILCMSSPQVAAKALRTLLQHLHDSHAHKSQNAGSVGQL